jgi:hypothetical protein
MLDTHNISYHIMEIKIKDDALTFARATMLVSRKPTNRLYMYPL